jgi:hypothetical protein
MMDQFFDSVPSIRPLRRRRRPDSTAAFLIGTIAAASAFGFLVFLGTSSGRVPAAKAVTPSKEEMPRIFRMDTAIHVGKLTYEVLRVRWSQHTSDNEFLDARPDAWFLVVELSVRNDDALPRAIPPFALVDDRGGVSETSKKALFSSGRVSRLDRINPGVSRTGTVTFDVSRDRKYLLHVCDGLPPNVEALISLAESD